MTEAPIFTAALRKALEQSEERRLSPEEFDARACYPTAGDRMRAICCTNSHFRTSLRLKLALSIPLTGEMVDRLLHYSHVIVISGPCYRDWQHNRTSALRTSVPRPLR